MSQGKPGWDVLERYHDGDLEAGAAAEVEADLAQSGEAREVMEGLRTVGDVVRTVAQRDATGFDPDRLWARLQPELGVVPAAQEAGRSTASRSLAQWLGQWLAPERAWILGQCAVAAVALALLWSPQAPDAPQAVVDNECLVDVVEAGEDHEVLVAQGSGPEAATVIWLLAADLGEATEE